MIWSFSSGKQFDGCPRQWYYRNVVADAKVKNDPFRREITILSKLKSLQAVRGSIVDDVISSKIVYAIRHGYSLRADYYIKEALAMLDNQVQFALSKKYRLPRFSFSDDDDFAALYAVEFGAGVKEEDIEIAKAEIIAAITNVLKNHELIKLLRDAKVLITQRALSFKFNKFSIRAVPDLIAFFDDVAPHIVDWKVHTFGTKDYEDQLQLYALALNKVISEKPHRDFPADASKFPLFEYKLIECQLLQEAAPRRNYDVTEASILQCEKKISSSILSIYQSGGFKGYTLTKPEMFRLTYYAEKCQTCPFHKVCKQQEYDIRDRCLSDIEPKPTYVQLPLI